MDRIVVGVDGSQESQQALEWAVEQARLTSSMVEVVYAYEYSPSWQLYGYEGLSIAEVELAAREEETVEREAVAYAEGLVSDMIAKLKNPEAVEIEPVIVNDRRPASALLKRAQDASLLVVGSRGRGGFAGLLLGSVSQQCASHATCPVVILGRTAVDESD